MNAYKKLENDSNKEFAVEALYYRAMDNFDNKEYLNSNLIIEKISNEFSGYKNGLQKVCCLCLKIFINWEMLFQASFILESVIENFSHMPNIVDNAKNELTKIKLIESEKNSSVEINN